MVASTIGIAKNPYGGKGELVMARIKAIKVTECIKRALNLDDDDVAIIRADGSPTDAWRLRKSGFEWFEEGLWLRAIDHIANCEGCRKELAITNSEIKAELALIVLMR